jgi:glycine/D-amino acid oxidase-like deaminating enzyme
MPDVVVVGAGVIGASVGWHLSRLGVRALLLEREPQPGKGSTGRATGGFRAQYGTDVNVRLSLLSREKLRRFIDDTSVDPGYDARGYLWLARTEAQLDVLRGAQDVQRAAGLVEASMLDLRQIGEVNPYIRTDGLAGAAFCPTDGYIRPLDILRGYLRGAQVRTSARVTGLRRRGSRIESVQLADGSEIPAGAVVDAAGPWAGPVARLAGVDVPVAPLRRQVGSTVDTEVLPAAMPMTVWVEDAFHVRARDGRVLLVWPTPGDPRDPESTAVEQDWLEQVRKKAAERVPALAGIPVDPARSWAGLYEMSPDQHALLGRAPECDNLYLCNGSSGHGVMHSPALGQLLAEIIVHGQSRSLDVDALRPSRFAEGRPNRAPQIL